jgi:hypothetical protein
MAITKATSSAVAPAAKGELVVGSATNDSGIVSVGANGTVLTADSAEATGVKWAAVAGGGETLITSGTLSGASVTISSIPTTYNDLKLVIRNFLPASTANIRARFNGDTATRYNSADGFTSDTNTAYSGDQMQLTNTQNSTSSNSLIVSTVLDYANTSTWKQIFTFAITNNATTVANFNFFPSKGYYNQNTAITSLTLFPNTGNFTSGDYFLYGVK